MNHNFEVEATDINGLFVIKPFISFDSRGYFKKDYSESLFSQFNIQHEIKETFYTKSKKGVIRGLHYLNPMDQAKLVSCIKGKIYDVVVDLRKNSNTYLKWQSFYIDEENHYGLLIPKGCAHGYMTIEDCILSYKCNAVFDVASDKGLHWTDPILNINWPVHLVGGIDKVIISNKDNELPFLNNEKGEYIL